MPSSSQRFLRPSVLNLRRNNAAVHCSLDTSNHHHHHNNDLDIQSIIEHEDDSVKSPSNFVVKFRSEEVSKGGNEEVNATIARTYPSSTPLSLCAPLVESSPGIRMDGEDVDNPRRARSSSNGNSFQQKGSPPPYSGGGPASSEEQLFVRAGGSNDRRNRLGEHGRFISYSGILLHSHLCCELTNHGSSLSQILTMWTHQTWIPCACALPRAPPRNFRPGESHCASSLWWVPTAYIHPVGQRTVQATAMEASKV